MQFTIAITTPRYNQYQASFSPFCSFREKAAWERGYRVACMQQTSGGVCPSGRNKDVRADPVVDIEYSPYSDVPTESGQSSQKNTRSQAFENVTYQEIDAGQRVQFEALLLKVYSILYSTCIQKMLITVTININDTCQSSKDQN